MSHLSLCRCHPEGPGWPSQYILRVLTLRSSVEAWCTDPGLGPIFLYSEPETH